MGLHSRRRGRTTGGDEGCKGGLREHSQFDPQHRVWGVCQAQLSQGTKARRNVPNPGTESLAQIEVRCRFWGDTSSPVGPGHIGPTCPPNPGADHLTWELLQARPGSSTTPGGSHDQQPQRDCRRTCFTDPSLNEVGVVNLKPLGVQTTTKTTLGTHQKRREGFWIGVSLLPKFTLSDSPETFFAFLPSENWSQQSGFLRCSFWVL